MNCVNAFEKALFSGSKLGKILKYLDADEIGGRYLGVETLDRCVLLEVGSGLMSTLGEPLKGIAFGLLG